MSDGISMLEYLTDNLVAEARIVSNRVNTGKRPDYGPLAKARDALYDHIARIACGEIEGEEWLLERGAELAARQPDDGRET